MDVHILLSPIEGWRLWRELAFVAIKCTRTFWDTFISKDIKSQKEFSNPKDRCTVVVLCVTCPFAEVMTTEEMFFDKHLCGSGRTSALGTGCK